MGHIGRFVVPTILLAVLSILSSAVADELSSTWSTSSCYGASPLLLALHKSHVPGIGFSSAPSQYLPAILGRHLARVALPDWRGSINNMLAS